MGRQDVYRAYDYFYACTRYVLHVVAPATGTSFAIRASVTNVLR